LNAYNVEVVDYIPAELTLNDANWTLDSNGSAYQSIAGPIAPGSCVPLSMTCTITSLPASGTVENFAEISAADDDTDPSNDPPTDADSTPDDDDGNDGPVTDDDTDNSNGDEDDHDPASFPVEEFDLALIKTLSSAGPFAPGDDITYTITVTNQGNVDAYQVELVDYVPVGLTLNDTDWTYAFPTATLNNPIAGPLAPGASVSVDIDFTIDPTFQGTSLTNYAEISAADNDTDPNNDPPTDSDSTPDDDNGNDAGGNPDGGTDNTTDGDGSGTPGDDDASGDEDDHDPETVNIGQTFDLALTKMIDPAQQYPIYVGDDVTYNIEVCNQGTLDAYQIQVVDYIPR